MKPSKRAKLGRALVAGAAVLLAASVALPTSVGAAGHPHVNAKLDRSVNVHPFLQYGAQAEPDKRVLVVVQTTTPSANAAEIARSAGAELRESFPFVHAYLMELPQKSVLKLANNPKVRYVSPDAVVHRTDAGDNASASAISPANLLTSYPFTVNATQVWNGTGPGAAARADTGDGVAVAVIDSGVNGGHPDFRSGQVQSVNVNSSVQSTADGNGHGTHVASIIGGRSSNGAYIGIAPGVRIYSVRISDDAGAATEADLLRGLQWVYENRSSTGIKLVNLSLTGSVAEPYGVSVVDAAVEQLWLHGVTVVVAAGNLGSAADAVDYAPANDPYVISVGALDDNQTRTTADDTLAPFSSRGTTQDGFAKPDVVAPGRRIVAALASHNATIAQSFPDRITADGQHIRLSGTSMAAPVVTGALALVLQHHPSLQPDQLKWLARQQGDRYPGESDAASMVDPHAMLSFLAAHTPAAANQGVTPNSGINVSNGTVRWSGSYWDASYWDASYWDASYWDASYWDVDTNLD